MKSKVLITLAITGGLIVATSYFLTATDTSPETAHLASPEAQDRKVLAKPNTVAAVWKWETPPTPQKVAENTNAKSVYDVDADAEFPFTQASVYQALSRVKLDEHGDIVIDDDALMALNDTFEHSDIQLDDKALTALQSLIQRGLPGLAGEQTAQLVADYYQYIGAKNEFNSLYESSSQDQEIEGYEAQYSELVALRELYLGAQVADDLFAVSDANARYMFESMKLEMNTSMSEEDKAQEQAKIVALHAESTTNVSNWNARYQAFSDDKRYIVDSSLSEAEKRNQLSTLMHEHFTVEELDAVSHLPLDML